jgi:hypothetical protein
LQEALGCAPALAMWLCAEGILDDFGRQRFQSSNHDILIHVLMCINRYVRGLAHTSDPNRSYISWMPNRLSHHHVRQARAAAGEAAKKVPQHFTGSSWWVHRWHFAQQLLLTEMWFDFWCRWNEMYCTLEECYL